jgi:hypothetical protein
VVSERIRFHLDEHISNAVAKALRQYAIDVTTPSEVRLRQASDHDHLEFARRTGRVFVTGDADFLRMHAAGVEHAGLAFVAPSRRNVGYIVERLRLLYEIMSPEEMVNTLEFL